MNVEEKPKNVWLFDLETIFNCFTMVCRRVDSKEYLTFVIHEPLEGMHGEFRNDFSELMAFLDSRPAFIGFNNLNFDGQIIEYIYRERIDKATKIYDFAQQCIERTNVNPWDTPYYPGSLTFNHLDLFKMNHYDKREKDEDGENRQTSLKWLEFTLRWKHLKDMPYEHTHRVIPGNVDKIVSYNKNDVDITYLFWERCGDQISLRREFAKKYMDASFMNKSDSSLGETVFLKTLASRMRVGEKELKKRKGTPRKEINVSECILPYVEFQSPEFNGILDQYRNLTIKAKEGEIKLKGVIKFSCDFEGLKFDYGAGGLHAFGSPRFYQAGNGKAIIDIDVSSYYPNLPIANRFYPEHLSEDFCDIYYEIFQERMKYEKKTAMNLGLKLALNAVFGKSNSKYSYLYDPKYTVQVTVNGQLLITMLAERLAEMSELIMCNTDGLTALVDEDKIPMFRLICSEFESLTKLPLEYNRYSKLAMRDVNNYIAQFEDGSIKRKGVFETYEDCVSLHQYHKNISQEIVALAAQEYYIKGIDPVDTIRGQEEIWPFLMAVKRQKNFQHIVWTADVDRYVSNKIFPERTFRFYASTDGGCLYKHFNDGRITAIKKEFLISPALNIRSTKISAFPNIDYSYYEKEVSKLIDEIGYGG